MAGDPIRGTRNVPPGRRRFFLGLGLCYVAYFTLIVYSEFRRPQAVGVRLTYLQENAYIASVAPDSPGARAGLKVGDRITGMGTAPLAALRDPYSFHARLPLDGPVPIRWIRDGREMQSILTLAYGERQFWGTREGVTLLLMRGAQLLMLALAFVIVWKRSEHGGAIVGAWLLASLGVYTIVLPAHMPSTWRALPGPLEAALWLPYLSSICAGAVLATFYTVFPERALRWRMLLGLIWGAAAPMIALSVYGALQVMYAPDQPSLLPALNAVPMVGNLVLISLGAVILVRNYRRLTSQTERRRVRLVLTSSAAVCLGASAAVAHWATRGSADLAGALFASRMLTLAFIPAVLVPFVFGYAILRHRLFDISLLLRRGLQYALARRVLLSLMPAIVLVFALDIYGQMRDGASVRGGRLWWYGGLLAAAAWTYSRRNEWLVALDRRYFREQYSAQRLLRALAEDLQTTRDIDDLLPAVARRIEAALHPRSIALLVRSQDGRFYESLESSAPGSPARLRFSAGDKVIRLLAVLGQPLIVGPAAPRSVFDQLPEDEQHAVASQATELLVPISGRGGAVEALLALGMKRSEEPFSSEDLDLLAAIAMNLGTRLPSRTTEECDACGASYASGTGRCAADGAVLVPSMTPPILADRYSIERRLGRGGMGIVYAARDLQLNRRIAIKLLNRVDAGRDTERLRREARAAARLTHPNVVTIHDIGVTDDGRPFLVMELLRGITLRQKLSSGPMPPAVLDPIFEGICAALEAAHAEKLVHRDLKPENVLLLNGADRAANVKLLDFGISMFVHDSGTPIRSDVLGTPEYAAPEQIRGDPPARAWDIWALGVIAFEALYGARPLAFAAGVLRGSPAVQGGAWTDLALPSTSPALTQFFGRVLSVDPASRPATAAEFLRELRNAHGING